MSNIFKRLAAMLMAIAMLASLAACNNDPETTGTKADAAQVQGVHAVTVGEHKVSAVELNYFFMDAIVDWYSVNSSLSYLMGFDATKPLNEQVLNDTTGKTWADSFLEMALDNIRSTYALYDLAIASGFQLSAAQQADVDNVINDLNETLETYAAYYEQMGYSYPYANAGEYLQTIYGLGSDEESYQHYYEVCRISDAYYMHYSESLTYDDKALRAYEADKYAHYSSFTYAAYFVDLVDYETAEQAEAAAQQLAGDSYTDQAAFDEAIKALPVNTGVENPKLSEAFENVLYSNVVSYYAEWLSQDSRISGDLGVLPKKDDADNLLGYYVVRFESVNDNQFPLKNVRHLLVAFEGGTFNAVTGQTTYSEAEIEAARVQANQYMLQFLSGISTELHFADMANAYSDDGDGTTGGLYENIYPGQMVEAFEAWCYDENRRPGDVDLVQTEYGWHIMYFVGNTDYTFRDYMLTNDLRTADVNAWYKALLDSVEPELLDDTHVNKALILSKM